MTATTLVYWGATGILALGLAAGGAFDLMLAPEIAEAMEHLGYPDYFARILGTWKVLAVPALLLPGFTRLKEWAYAGVIFNMTGAAASHLAVGDGLGGAGAPLFLATLAVVSWATAPAARQLGQRLPLPEAAGSVATA